MITALIFVAAYIFVGMGHAGKYLQGYAIDRPYHWHPVASWFFWPVYVAANREAGFAFYAVCIFAFVYGFAG